MMLTVWSRQGKKSIHLPLEALDKVREMVYNNSEYIIEYSICWCDYEREFDNGVISQDNKTEVWSE